MISTKRKMGFLAAAFMLAAVFIVSLIGVSKNRSLNNSIVWDSPWEVTYHGKTSQPPSLAQYRPIQGEAPLGDSLLLETTLPTRLSDYSALHIRLFVSTMDVYLNDEKIYSYGQELLSEGLIVGSGYHRIELPAGWGGQKLRLKVYAAESGAFDIMPETTILPNQMMGAPYLAEHISVSFCIAIFMTLFGAMAMVGGIGAMGFAGYFVRLPLIGFFSFVLGIWTICYTHEIQLISLNLEFNAILEYAMLYLAPISIELLFVSMRRKKLSGWRWYGLVSLPIFNGIFFAGTTILQLAHVANYPQFLLLFHIYMVLGIVFLMVPGVVYSKKDGLPERISDIGFLLFCLSCIAELVVFNLSRVTPGVDPRGNPITSWGLLVYLMSLLVSYVIYLQRAIVNKTEKDLLSSLAYRDALTGLYNRAKCEQIFDVLNGIGSDYAVTSIDMNGLKKLNDTYGHGKGDEQLQAFAKTLSEAFKGIGTPIRMGGDEFLVIVRQEHLNDMETAFEKMRVLQEEASQVLPIPLSASYGTAMRSEVRSTAGDVYRLADDRMYKMKKESKDTRED